MEYIKASDLMRESLFLVFTRLSVIIAQPLLLPCRARATFELVDRFQNRTVRRSEDKIMTTGNSLGLM